MREQAQLTSKRAPGHPDQVEHTVRTLKATARQSQGKIRDLLRRWEAAGSVSEVTPLWVTNALSVTATSTVIRKLATRSDVLSITPDALTLTPAANAVEPNISVVGADAVWEQGARGGGVVVASLDSGVDVSHPDLAARWRGGSNSWFDPYNEHPTTPTDLTGHGTGTVGVMVGGSAGGTAIGVAPDAEWIAAKIFNDTGATTVTAVHEAFQWVLDPDDDPTTDDAPDVVNGSWSLGSGPGCDLSLQPDLQALRAAGIVPVFAAGNFGPGGTSSVSPANYPEALSVGAVTNGDLIYSASSRGPSNCGGRTRVFPDVVAPGVNVTTADRYGQYQTVSGTSVAAPHVSGALALLLGESRGLPQGAQESALISGAVDLGTAGPDSTYGAGRINVPAAMVEQSAMPGFSVTTPTSAVNANAGSTAEADLTVAARNGFVGVVSLSTSSLPAAVGTAVVTPDSVVGSGTSTLHLSLAVDAPAGTYPMTVSGISGTAVDRASLSVTVPPQDFTL
ncbi:MAG: S8 family serine peptidase, partial [Candidatus Nanopelagicales bacterium]